MLPESLQICSESRQVIVIPAVEMKADRPDPNGQPSKSAHLLWNPKHTPFVCIGIERVPIVNNAHPHPQQNTDRIDIERMRRRHPHFRLYPVLVKNPHGILKLDRKSTRLNSSHMS